MRTPIACTVAGDRGSPPLMLVHAVGGDSRMWDECTAAWSRRFHVIACDLRGAGRTPPPPRPWTPADHVRDMDELRASLGLERVLPIGVASGAFIAASYAAAHPQNVRGVVISDGTPQLAAHSRERVEARLAKVHAGGMQAILPAAIDLAFTGLPKDERYARYTQRFVENDPHGYAMLALGMLDSDLVPGLRAITVPALVLVGEYDAIYPVAQSQEIASHLGDVEFRILERASHFAPCQNPALFAQVVEEFATRRARS